MTATFDAKHAHPARKRTDDEPWPIWAALMVFLNILVISGMVWGLPGLVTVMVGAAIAMVLLLMLIVTG
ncbi:MAG: hypothetical protein EA407_09455 [Rhodobacteraceae bacterium]|nr:MAG: hypothetical protein EA407_09455 [Paracoccaceae bacterium]